MKDVWSNFVVEKLYPGEGNEISDDALRYEINRAGGVSYGIPYLLPSFSCICFKYHLPNSVVPTEREREMLVSYV